MKKIILSVLFFALIGIFSSCDDATNPEALDIYNPEIPEDNESYQEYLEHLRNYKKSYHKILIGWFDNKNTHPSSRASHIASVPDKVDIVSIIYGDELSEKNIEEIASIRKDKGTKVIYTIDFVSFKQELESRNQEILDEGLDEELRDLLGELPEFMNTQLALLEKYYYDGVSIHYESKFTQTLSTEEINLIRSSEEIIFEKFSAAMNSNPTKLFLFEGNPSYLFNMEILDKFNYIVWRSTYSAESILQVNEIIHNSLENGVPRDKVIICAIPLSPDGSDNKRGKILTKDGSEEVAIIEMAHWVGTSEAFTKAGLGIYLLNDDYYNAELDYKYTREAINIMNPSPLN